MRRRSLALLILAGWCLTWPPSPGQSEEEDEVLPPGPPLGRAITSKAHVYRVEVGEEPVVVLVDQQGIDLLVEARGPAGQEPLIASVPNHRWGPEVLVLSAGAAARYRVEVRPRKKSLTGRYTIQAETMDARRAAAFQAMSRAGQLALGSPESGSEALSAYREALASWRALGDRRWEAETLFDIAALEQQAADLRAAATDYRQALALWRELAEPPRLAAVLDMLGNALVRSGDFVAARAASEEALALWRRLGERIEEQNTRNDLCILDLSTGALSTALACFEELLAIYREHGNLDGEARSLTNLGGVYDEMGDPDAALDHYGKALPFWQAIGDRAEEAGTLKNMGVVHRALGEWQEALRLYGRTREILTELGDPIQEATLHNSIGFAYNSLGDPQRALVFLVEALKLRRKAGERRGEIQTLNSLGTTWRDLGDLDKALAHHRQALELAVGLKDSRQEALSRLGLGQVHFERGEAPAALRELAPALAHFREAGLRAREAQALQVQGRALALAGRPQEALAMLQEVLERLRVLRDRAGEAETLRALAVVERSLGRLEEARGHAGQAIVLVEELRTGFVSPDLRAAFLATRRRAYELAIDLLMEQHGKEPKAGHDRKAFELSEQVRARTLLDVLQPGNGSRGESVAPSALTEKRQSLRRRLSVRAAQQVTRAGGGKSEALEQEMESLRAELDGVEAEIRRHDPRYSAFSEPPSMSAEETTRLLDPGTLLLEYSLGDERSFLWAVGAKGLRSFVLPPRKEIESLVRQVYEDLSTVGTGSARSQEEETLGRVLLEPVWAEAAQIQRLLVVPDGALHVLPFAALRVPEPGRGWTAAGARQQLLTYQEVVYIPSATTLAVERQRLEQRPPAPKWAAILADPVFSPEDARLSKQATSSKGDALRGDESPVSLLPSFERLPSSRREAEEIAALAPAGQVWKGFDLQASRDAVLSGELQAYRVVHFATHGIADTRNPELSGLVLSLVDAGGKPRDGFLGLTDIYDLNLAADLVVLSGCRTGLGKEVRGEGLMGLTRGFLYAGVPRVIGSLWPVQDRTAAELMSRFYKAMWKDGLPPAAALREAQRSLRSNPRYRDPYSWAGFILQGDWRGNPVHLASPVR